MMRVFEHFNASYGSICPICGTAADRPTVLVPIPGTEDDGIFEANQVHKQCFDLATEMAEAELANAPSHRDAQGSSRGSGGLTGSTTKEET